MRKRFSGSMITVATIAGVAVSAGISVPITRTLAQARCFRRRASHSAGSVSLFAACSKNHSGLHLA